MSRNTPLLAECEHVFLVEGLSRLRRFLEVLPVRVV
jgi:hypothetical protein